jgi:hypothetical protein
MKKLIFCTRLSHIAYLLLGAVFISSCKHDAEFYINGKPYYTQSICVKDTTYQDFCYHYGLSYRGKFELHWGFQTKNKCLEQTIDTIQIK